MPFIISYLKHKTKKFFAVVKFIKPFQDEQHGVLASVSQHPAGSG